MPTGAERRTAQRLAADFLESFALGSGLLGPFSETLRDTTSGIRQGAIAFGLTRTGRVSPQRAVPVAIAVDLALQEAVRRGARSATGAGQ